VAPPGNQAETEKTNLGLQPWKVPSLLDNPYPCSEKQVSIMANYTPRVGVWKGIYSKAIRCRQNIIKSKPVFWIFEKQEAIETMPRN
jgi:hypothetical protein